MSESLINFIPVVLIPLITFGVWKYLESKKEFSKKRKLCFWIGFTSFYLTEIARSYYRPFIYSNEINDFHIADTIGNSLGTVTAIFVILTLAGKGFKSDWKLVLIIIAGLVSYELLNFASSTPIDVRDIIATLVFGGLSMMTYHKISRYKTVN